MNMKRLAGFLLFSIMLTGTALSQESPVMVGDISVSGDDYRIYRSDGTPSSLAEIRAALGDYDVVFVGELHNDPVSHAIEQEVPSRMVRGARKCSGAKYGDVCPGCAVHRG